MPVKSWGGPMNRATSGLGRVLSFLLEQRSPVTRPMIATACRLSRPTVFAAVDRLVEAGLVHDAGQLSGSPRPSAALYEISPAAGVLAAVDIGGSNTRAAVTDIRGQILDERREATSAGGGPRIADQAVRLVKAALSTAGVDAETLSTVAVSVP